MMSLEPSTDRKSTRLNSSHLVISYAVFCLKKKTKKRGSMLGDTSILELNQTTVYILLHVETLRSHSSRVHVCRAPFCVVFFFFFFLIMRPPPRSPLFPSPPLFR